MFIFKKKKNKNDNQVLFWGVTWISWHELRGWPTTTETGKKTIEANMLLPISNRTQKKKTPSLSVGWIHLWGIRFKERFGSLGREQYKNHIGQVDSLQNIARGTYTSGKVRQRFLRRQAADECCTTWTLQDWQSRSAVSIVPTSIYNVNYSEAEMDTTTHFLLNKEHWVPGYC